MKMVGGEEPMVGGEEAYQIRNKILFEVILSLWSIWKLLSYKIKRRRTYLYDSVVL